MTYPNMVANSKANIVRAGMYQSYQNGNLNFATFDNYVAYAKRYGLRIIPVLTDNWGQCGDKRKHLHWYQTGYTRRQSLSQPMSYEGYAEAFVRRYANDPTIAWYQLVNEPDARNPDGSCDEPAAAEALRKFADTMTGIIKSIDPNHMVDLGSVSWCGGQSSDFGYVSAGKVDLCDAYHDYTAGIDAMPSSLKSHLEQCITKDKKPSFVGEAGICAYVNAAGNCALPTTATTLQNRAGDFSAKITAGLKAGLSGYLIWSISKGCSGTTSREMWNIGANNSTLAYGCAVREIDPTETRLAGFAAP